MSPDIRRTPSNCDRTTASIVPCVSVVIPVFNQALLIANAVQSVLRQSLPAHEIIVVDDGSTDGTRASVDEIAAKHGEVNYLYQPNAGVSAARNHGIRRATGEWVAFLDSDDTWRPDLLSHAHAEMRSNPDIQFIHVRRSNAFPDGTTNDGPALTEAQMRDPQFLLSCFAIRTCGAMIRRDLLDALGQWFPESQRTGEDFHLFARAVMLAHAIGFINSHDAVVYMTPNSLSRGSSASSLLRDNVLTLQYLIAWSTDRALDARYAQTLRSHQYWRFRELFLTRLKGRELSTLIRETKLAMHEQGLRRTSRALASAVLGVVARE